MNQSDISRIIEMAWEDRTPFDAIEIQFGLNEQGGQGINESEFEILILSILAKKSFWKINKTFGKEKF